MTVEGGSPGIGKRKLSRRELLQLGAGVGLSTAGAAVLAACGAPLPAAAPKPAATTAPAAAAKPPAATQPVTVSLVGWAFAVEVVQETVNEFKRQVPGVNVDYTAYPTQQWRPQMTAVFVAGTPVIDVLFLREEIMGGWIEAGYLQPIEGLPGVEEHKKLLYPGPLADTMYKGKMYSLPYYASFTTCVVNKKMLNDAGFGAPPKTWDEVKTQAEAIRKAKILESPLTLPFRKSEFYTDWWGMVYASGGHFFDENDAPVFAGKDPVALEVLERIVDLAKSKLLDVRSLEVDTLQGRDAFMAGQSAMTTVLAHQLEQITDPQKSKVAKDALLINIPSLGGQMKGTMGMTRLYGIGAKTRNLERSWELMSFLGGKDKRGDFWTAKYWVTKAGQFSAYKPVMEDPTIQASIAKWFDPKLFVAQQALARPREALKTSWFAEWDTFNQEQLQAAILGRSTPKDALKASADKALDLAKRR